MAYGQGRRNELAAARLEALGIQLPSGRAAYGYWRDVVSAAARGLSRSQGHGTPRRGERSVTAERAAGAGVLRQPHPTAVEGLKAQGKVRSSRPSRRRDLDDFERREIREVLRDVGRPKEEGRWNDRHYHQSADAGGTREFSSAREAYLAIAYDAALKRLSQYPDMVVVQRRREGGRWVYEIFVANNTP